MQDSILAQLSCPQGEAQGCAKCRALDAATGKQSDRSIFESLLLLSLGKCRRKRTTHCILAGFITTRVTTK